MKIIHVSNYLTLGLIILALLNSCASTGFLKSKPKVSMFTNPYPPKGINAPIDVYQTNRPTREYIEIAKISCGAYDDSWNMSQILIKAREIGADGIIIVGRAGSYAAGVPVGNMIYAVGEGYGLTAIAIVYK